MTTHTDHQPRRFTAPIIGLLAIAMSFATIAPAGAQDDDDSGTDGTVQIDFTDAVEIGPDGTPIWTEENPDPTAQDPLESTDGSTTPAEDGIVGSGSVDSSNPATVPPATATDGETVAETDAGSDGPRIRDEVPSSEGPSRTGWYLVLGLLALSAIGFFVYRSRFSEDEEDDSDSDLDGHIETVLPMGSPDDLVGSAEPAYAGASEGGAYDQGGAAYAQYADPTYSPGEISDEKVSFKDQVINFADKKLAEQGKAKMLERHLQAAGSKMRPGEWLVFAMAGSLVGLAVGWIVLGPIIGVIIAVLVAVGFWAQLGRGADKRREAFADSLPETLGLLSGSLRSGMSMMQAVQTVAEEADEPTAGEFQRVITEIRLGRELSHSFKDMSQRMQSEDFEWVVTAVEINNEVGGDLSVILDRVGGVIRARNRVRGQVKALSAEGRMSGLVLFCLPPAMTGIIAMSNRGYLNEMIETGVGQVVLVAATVLLLLGGVWLKHISRFVY